MRQPGRAAYPVRKCRVEQAPDTARELATEDRYDLLFFDLPGTVNSAGILRTIAQMDYIFAPVSADKVVLESTLAFLDVLQRMMLGKETTSRLKGIYLFWNLVDRRETSGWLLKWGYPCYRHESQTRNVSAKRRTEGIGWRSAPPCYPLTSG